LPKERFMKVVIIGAGSAFGSRLSVDILSREPICDATIALCDLNAERLELVKNYVRKVISTNGLPAEVVASTDRRELLEGADAVVISVSVGGPAYSGTPYRWEIDIPKEYGIRQPVGDTVGVGGVFRGLRTAPVLEEIARDVDELAPGALLINYTNPMCILTWRLSEVYPGPVVGLCHGVQNTSRHAAEWIGAPFEACGFWFAGINHMAWMLEFTHDGEDAYPRLREAMEDPKIYEQEPVRFDILKHVGYFCTEGSRHSSEYMPYFYRDTERMKTFSAVTEGVPGKRQSWYEDMGVSVEQAESVELVRSHEYASAILEARVTSVPLRFNGNVANDRLIDGLPDGCCVEVPVLADGEGIHPCRVPWMPEHCLALNRTNVNVQAVALESIRHRCKEDAWHAVMLDPMTAAMVDLDTMREMFERLWAAEGELLGEYR
jgi:alpha-galactosidase